MDELQEQIEDLKTKISRLETARVYQMDITPQAVKNRHLGEPNTYIYSGLEADLPTEGVQLTSTGLGCSVYWCTDSGKLKIWNGTAWKSVTLS